MRQSDREKEFWIDQKVYGHPVSLKLYALMKAVLFLIAIGGVMLILVSLVYGQVPTWRDFSNKKFLWLYAVPAFSSLCSSGLWDSIRISICRKVQHRESIPVLSADRNHHRHTACWNLHRSVLIYLPSAGASGRNICRSVTSVRNSHLRNGNPVQLQQPLSLRYPIIDEYGIQTFQIGKADQFIDIGVIPDVSFFIGIGFPPFLSCHPEHRHIQDIRFIRINNGGFAAVKFRRNQVLLDGIRMNPVIQFGKLSLRAPAKLFLFFLFKTLKLFVKIQLKFNGNPACKFKSNVLVGKRPTISSGLYANSCGVGGNDPFQWR